MRQGLFALTHILILASSPSSGYAVSGRHLQVAVAEEVHLRRRDAAPSTSTNNQHLATANNGPAEPSTTAKGDKDHNEFGGRLLSTALLYDCDPQRCICSPEQYVELFEKTGEPEFTFDSMALGLTLNLGRFKAKQILSNLGFGPVDQVTCDDRQWLAVWREPVGIAHTSSSSSTASLRGPGNGIGNVRAVWSAVVGFLEEVYDEDLRFLDPAAALLGQQTFEDLTCCNASQISLLQSGKRPGAKWATDPYDSHLLQQIAGCAPAFAKAVQGFRNTPYSCVPNVTASAGDPRPALFYHPNNVFCTTDLAFLNLRETAANLSTWELAQTLRGFLYSRFNFNQFYGGWGFTTNDHVHGIYPEFWRSNALLGQLNAATTQLDCTLKPSRRRAARRPLALGLEPSTGEPILQEDEEEEEQVAVNTDFAYMGYGGSSHGVELLAAASGGDEEESLRLFATFRNGADDVYGPAAENLRRRAK